MGFIAIHEQQFKCVYDKDIIAKKSSSTMKHNTRWYMRKLQYGPVTMIVPASGHQVRCIPWVQMGTFNKEIGFLCGL